jgi:hypothetical protein
LRGKHLRELLSVDKRSPLNSRTLRNYFEHYDENLHEWAQKSNRVLINRNIAAKGFATGSGIDEYADMGNLDPNNFMLTFWNQKVEIPVLIKSVEELLATVQKKSAERFFPV